MKSKTGWTIIVAVIVVGGITFYLNQRKPVQLPAIPAAVVAKYEELKTTYANSLGATLSQCVKGSQKIYQVVGSGGFTGIRVYYSASGRELERKEFSDAVGVDVNNPQAPETINIAEYQCTKLATSQ